jgi:hypothetical protein
MESKHTSDAVLHSRIAELSYDPTLSDKDIVMMIHAETGLFISEAYVAQVIADFIADMYEGEREMSDEGYDPYMNTYTDDC